MTRKERENLVIISNPFYLEDVYKRQLEKEKPEILHIEDADFQELYDDEKE